MASFSYFYYKRRSIPIQLTQLHQPFLFKPGFFPEREMAAAVRPLPFVFTYSETAGVFSFFLPEKKEETAKRIKLMR